MHTAPAILVSVSACPLWRGAQFAVATVAAAGLMAWAWPHGMTQTVEWRSGMVLATLLVGLGLIARLLAQGRSPSGKLLWTGQVWQWLATHSEVGQVRIAIDLGHWLLLAFHPDDASQPTRWLPLRRSMVDTDWHALNCALRQSRGRESTRTAITAPSPGPR